MSPYTEKLDKFIIMSLPNFRGIHDHDNQLRFVEIKEKAIVLYSPCPFRSLKSENKYKTSAKCHLDSVPLDVSALVTVLLPKNK